MPLFPTTVRLGRFLRCRCLNLAAASASSSPPPARGVATGAATGATAAPYKRARGKRRSTKPPPPPLPHPPRCPLPPLKPGSVDPPSYAARLDHKVTALTDLLSGVGALPPAPLAVYPSPPSGYRARAEFRVWHDDGEVYFIMFDDAVPAPDGIDRPPGAKAPPARVRIEYFPIGTPLMNVLMDELMAAVREEAGVVGGGDKSVQPDPATSPLRARLFQANFLTTLAGGSVVSLVYHRTLGEDWVTAAEKLRARLEAAAKAAAAASGGTWAAGRVEVVGRSRNQRLDVASNHTDEALAIGHGRTLTYRHVEGAFSQPNPTVCASMLAWAVAAAGGRAPVDGGADATPPPALPSAQEGDDLLELYCGGGAFTVALAPTFRRTLATEVSRTSVAAAAVNLAANGLGDGGGADQSVPVMVIRADAADVAAVLANCEAAAAAGLDALPPPDAGSDPPPMKIGGRAPGAVDPRAWRLSTLFVDPPRAGVGPACAHTLLPRFDRILYISCNPATLAADVAGLVAADSHVPVAAALFDQFPYTDHIECGLLLERKN